MNAYMACCCGDDYPTCDNQVGTDPCPAVAIVVEGEARLSISGGMTEEDSVVCQCECCDDLDPACQFGDEEITTTNIGNGTSYRRVSFKCLLQVVTGTSGLTFETSSDQASPYPPVFSMQASANSSYSYSQVGQINGCTGPDPSPCPYISRNTDYRSEEVDTGQEEIVPLRFSMQRYVRYFSCDQITPCATEGCYEIFELSSLGSLVFEKTTDTSSSFHLTTINQFSGECVDLVNTSDYDQDVNQITADIPINMKQFSEIRPSEPNVCPRPQQRPVNFTLNESVPYAGPNQQCTVQQQCQCSDYKNGFLLFAYDTQLTGGVGVEISPPTSFGAFTDVCGGYFSGRGGSKNFSANGGMSAGCDGSPPDCINSTACGPPRPGASGCGTGVGVRNRSQTIYGLVDSDFTLTRYELLYDLPDPSDWPNNV
jgi:hypothetical protein